MTTNTTVVSFIPRARRGLEEVSCCSDVTEGEEEAAASRSQVTDRSPVNPLTSRTVLRDIIGDFDPLPFCLRTCDSFNYVTHSGLSWMSLRRSLLAAISAVLLRLQDSRSISPSFGYSCKRMCLPYFFVCCMYWSVLYVLLVSMVGS